MATNFRRNKSTKLPITQKTIEVDLPTTTSTTAKPVVMTSSGQMAIGISLGGGSDSTPFNGERPIALGVPGLQGKTLGGETTGEVLKNLLIALYPALGPTCTLTADNPSREFGSSPSVRLYYNAYAGDAPLVTISIDGIPLDIEQDAGAYDTTTQPNQSQTFTLQVQDETDLASSAQVGINYFHNRFWFTSADNLLGQSDSQLSTLLQGIGTKEFATSRNQTQVFNLVDQYIYFAYPESFGEASFKVGGFSNNAFQTKTFAYTNSFGFVHTYRLYRSGNRGNNPTDVVVN